MRNIFRKLFKSNISLIDTMPPLKGRVLAKQPLNKKTWFGVGGCAEVYVEPADTDDLSRLLQFMPHVPLTILGGGSNVLIRDGGIPGVTVHLGKEFHNIKFDDEIVICDGGVSLMELARAAAKQGVSGFEFLSGIPGTIGGAVRMNAGAHGKCFDDILLSLTVVTREGEIREIDPKETEIFGYRMCYLPSDWIFVRAVLRGNKGNTTDIMAKMLEYKKQRQNNQPTGVKTAGSTFKNPQGLQAWSLIDKAGFRGYRRGGAVVSDKHTNFLINLGGATAKDIESLGEEIREKVWNDFGVELEWEIKKMGIEKE
ncbi:MAG: UDP-N-acetylmuramate dehydrogenase [Alphaproteobacteria bacterium]|nr:UDP-N-acetylmuramate dehydrogenase [Alphaproteobacteria bacterium]